jgi:hypothetical protein
MNADQAGMDDVLLLQPKRHVFRSECCEKFRSGITPNSVIGCTPLNLVIVDDEFFLQDFDGIQPVRLLFLGQHNLSKITLAEDSQKVEVV